jgi:hypothetical protein
VKCVWRWRIPTLEPDANSGQYEVWGKRDGRWRYKRLRGCHVTVPLPDPHQTELAIDVVWSLFNAVKPQVPSRARNASQLRGMSAVAASAEIVAFSCENVKSGRPKWKTLTSKRKGKISALFGVLVLRAPSVLPGVRRGKCVILTSIKKRSLDDPRCAVPPSPALRKSFVAIMQTSDYAWCDPQSMNPED